MTQETDNIPAFDTSEVVESYAQGHMLTPAERWEATHVRPADDTKDASRKTGDVALLAIIALAFVSGVAALVFAIARLVTP